MDVLGLHNFLQDGLEQGVAPCFYASVGIEGSVVFKKHGGCSAIYPEAVPLTEDMLFDMASLSKLMGTTFAALRMIDRGVIDLDSRVGEFFANCYGKEDITVCSLLTHTSGIKAHFPLYLRDITPEDASDEILKEPYGYTPSSDAVYSCMGFILLGKILESIAGKSLDVIVNEEVFIPLGMKNACYNPKNKKCVSTERDPQGNIINGIVHDENAAFLGGVSGNAGIFCDMDDCIRFANMLLSRADGYISRDLFDLAVKNHTQGLSEDRGLGFQLNGALVGHNGFTGTSLYCDLERQRFSILLTNRIHPTRDNYKLFPFRRQFHDMVFGD